MRLCAVAGCDRVAYGRGWCKLHWKRWWRHGDPLHVERIIGDDEARFLSKVDKIGPAPEYRPDLGSCWLWTACLNACGYGSFGAGGSTVLAHRWAYIRWVGPIPAHLEPDHLCRRRSCVRPSHLELVTHTENIRRGDAPLVNLRKTHCPQGHPYDDANTYVKANGARVCRNCSRAATARWKAKRGGVVPSGSSLSR